MTSAPVSPTTPELQATNDRPQHANPMVSHDTLLNDEEVCTHIYIYVGIFLYNRSGCSEYLVICGDIAEA